MPVPTASPRNNPSRLFRRLLGLYPEDFRAEWGPEMEELFHQRSRREPLHRLLAEVVIDTCKTAPKEHLAMLHQDVKYALRGLRKNPGFTAVAVLSLALGIGANSAIFSLAHALLLRPLPVTAPSELLIVQGTRIGDDGPRGISHPDFLQLRQHSQSFQSLLASSDALLSFAPRPADVPQLKMASYVSANYFDVLGVPIALGRAFRPDEDEAPGRNPVVVISHNLWTDAFQSDPAILGRRIQLNSVELTVIGVAAPGFDGLQNMLRTSLFLPIMMSPALTPNPKDAIPNRHDTRPLTVRGRLRPGVSQAQANTEIAALTRNLEKEFPATNQGRSARVRTEFQQRVDDSPPDALLMGSLLATTFLVLVIACVNVANLLLVRGQTRARDVAIRLAIGASRSRLLREMLTESLLLSLAGGAVGLLFASFATRAFNTIQPPTNFPIDLDISIDLPVLAFSLALSLASALLFGFLPAWRGIRPDLVTGLKGTESTPASLWGRGALVTLQVAVSCVLLIAAAMMVSGMRTTLLKDPGFRIDNLLLTGMDPRSLGAGAAEFYNRLLLRAREIPGVRSAALASTVPTANDFIRFARVAPEGFVPPQGQHDVSVFETAVSEDYFETAGIPILSGRPFTRRDDASAPRVAIVNDLFAERFWPGQSALGKTFRHAGRNVEIVGVARRIKYIFVGEAPTPAVYFPFRQEESLRMVLLTQTATGAATLATPIRQLIHELAPAIPIFGLRTMADYHNLRSVSIVNLLVNTVLALGLLGLTLALVGLYGTMSYAVSRRTKEIGIRMAIGAAPSSIMALVLRQGAWMAGTGIGIGMAVGIAAAGAMEQAFLGMAIASPAAFLAVPVLLGAAALAACWLPARRAASTLPTQALKNGTGCT